MHKNQMVSVSVQKRLYKYILAVSFKFKHVFLEGEGKFWKHLKVTSFLRLLPKFEKQ